MQLINQTKFCLFFCKLLRKKFTENEGTNAKGDSSRIEGHQNRMLPHLVKFWSWEYWNRTEGSSWFVPEKQLRNIFKHMTAQYPKADDLVFNIYESESQQIFKGWCDVIHFLVSVVSYRSILDDLIDYHSKTIKDNITVKLSTLKMGRCFYRNNSAVLRLNYKSSAIKRTLIIRDMLDCASHLYFHTSHTAAQRHPKGFGAIWVCLLNPYPEKARPSSQAVRKHPAPSLPAPVLHSGLLLLSSKSFVPKNENIRPLNSVSGLTVQRGGSS